MKVVYKWRKYYMWRHRLCTQIYMILDMGVKFSVRCVSIFILANLIPALLKNHNIYRHKAS